MKKVNLHQRSAMIMDRIKKRNRNHNPLNELLCSPVFQGICLSVLVNTVLFLIVMKCYPPVFTTNDDYRMRLLVSGAYTGEPSSEIVFMYRWIGIVLSFIYRISTILNWYGIFIIGTMFVPCCILFYHIWNQSTGRKRIGLSGLYVLIFVLQLQKHIMMPQFTVSSAFMFMGGLILEVRCFQFWQTDKRRRWWNLVGMAVCFLLSVSIREKVFLMLLPGSVILLLANIFWKKGIASWKRYLVLLIPAGILIVAIGGQRLLTLSSSYQEYVAFNQARSSVYDYNGVPDYDTNQEFYESIGMSKAAWNAISVRMFDVSDEISSENLEAIAEYSKTLDQSSVWDKLKGAVKSAYISATEDVVKGQFFACLLLLGVVMWFNSRIPDKRYTYLTMMTAAYAIVALILFGYVGRIMPRIVESLYLMFAGIALTQLIAMLSLEEYSVPQSALPADCPPIWNLVRYGTAGVLSVTMLLYNAVYLHENGAYNNLISNAACLDSLESYAKQDEDMYIFYNAMDFIACSDWVFDGEDGRFSQIDSLGNWNAMSDTWRERNAILGYDTALEALIGNENVYYAEIGAFHAEISDLLEEQACYLQTYDSYTIGSTTITIYRVVEYEKGDKRR